mmetsp:Transcript_26755/g.79846  ORF Transcript_26755/g.79846 Transcript_26755/m.79846 type:complete len:242 (-) Transcript_26755:314-1039(-)
MRRRSRATFRGCSSAPSQCAGPTRGCPSGWPTSATSPASSGTACTSGGSSGKTSAACGCCSTTLAGPGSCPRSSRALATSMICCARASAQCPTRGITRASTTTRCGQTKSGVACCPSRATQWRCSRSSRGGCGAGTCPTARCAPPPPAGMRLGRAGRPTSAAAASSAPLRFTRASRRRGSTSRCVRPPLQRPPPPRQTTWFQPRSGATGRSQRAPRRALSAGSSTARLSPGCTARTSPTAR